jgi:hypothetical protein
MGVKPGVSSGLLEKDLELIQAVCRKDLVIEAVELFFFFDKVAFF